MLVAIYNRWSGGLPWDRAHASPYAPTEVMLGITAWAALLLVTLTGLRLLTAASRCGRQPTAAVH